MPIPRENEIPPEPLTDGEKKEILKNIKDEVENLSIREFVIKPSVENYDAEKTYVIYDKKEIFIYDGELHRMRLAQGLCSSFYISRPDRHV